MPVAPRTPTLSFFWLMALRRARKGKDYSIPFRTLALTRESVGVVACLGGVMRQGARERGGVEDLLHEEPLRRRGRPGGGAIGAGEERRDRRGGPPPLPHLDQGADDVPDHVLHEGGRLDDHLDPPPRLAEDVEPADLADGVERGAV